MLSALVICCKSLLKLLANLGMEANSVDPDLAVPI